MNFTEARILDKNTIALGVKPEVMMERAGKAVADAVLKHMKGRGKTVAIVCGTGNNGGDGFVAARYLAPEAKVKVVLVRSELYIISSTMRLGKPECGGAFDVEFVKLKNDVHDPISKVNFNRLKGLVPIYSWEDYDGGCDIIVDALLGVGSVGEVREPYLGCIRDLNAHGKPTLSVDVPSGLGTRASIKPKVTVTFHEAKDGMNPANSGKIIVSDIGIPPEAGLIGPGDLQVLYPRPAKGSRKGQNGRVLVVGGGPYAGAPALAALAALRVGADLSVVAAPEPTARTIAACSPNLIVKPLGGAALRPSNVKECLDLARDADAVLIGPGAGRTEETLEALAELIAECKKPMVVDADGLRAIGRKHGILGGKRGILTPHAGEFALLAGKAPPDEPAPRGKAVARLSKSTGFAILQKGAVDAVSDGTTVKFNHTGNDGMTVGGTGDVLAGLCAGLLAKGAPPFAAARMAAFVNGSAGDMAFAEKSYGLVATDVLENVPRVLVKWL
ncbi:MAG: NAD(P)H-hydrate dehydratase [Methanobacteriota archaeon]